MLLCGAIQIVQHHLLRVLSFLLLVKNWGVCRNVGLLVDPQIHSIDQRVCLMPCWFYY